MCIVCAMIMMKVMIMKFLQMLGWRRGIWRAPHCPGLALSINTLYHYHWKYHYRWKYHYHWKYHFIFEPTIDHFGPRVPCCLILGHIGPVGKFLATQALIVILSPIFQHGILPRLKTLMKMMVCTAGHLLVGTKALNRRGGAEEQGRPAAEAWASSWSILAPGARESLNSQFCSPRIPPFPQDSQFGDCQQTFGKKCPSMQWGNYWHQDFWLLDSGETWQIQFVFGLRLFIAPKLLLLYFELLWLVD